MCYATHNCRTGCINVRKCNSINLCRFTTAVNNIRTRDIQTVEKICLVIDVVTLWYLIFRCFFLDDISVRKWCYVLFCSRIPWIFSILRPCGCSWFILCKDKERSGDLLYSCIIPVDRRRPKYTSWTYYGKIR